MAHANSAAFDFSQFVTRTDDFVEIRCAVPERSTISYIRYPADVLTHQCDALAASVKTLAKKKIIPAAFAETIIQAQIALKGE